MGILSNFSWLRGLRTAVADESAEIDVRPALASEQRIALDLAARRSDGSDDAKQAQLLGNIAEAHQGDLGGPWVVSQNGRLITAVLPVISAGKTMLVFAGLHAPTPFHLRCARQLIDATCTRALSQGVHLSQALADPADAAGQALLASAGFHRLAELVYLQGSPSRGLKEPPLPPTMRWRTYSSQTHPLFARAVLESYQNSLDCPGLNGLRSIDDILAGHQATGEFDPQLWFVLTHQARGNEAPAGVLLLSRVPRAGVTELVYLGLSPEFRGQGLGDVLLRRGLMVVAGEPGAKMSLAVDAENAPALRLYWRHGLQSVGRKVAMLRVLGGRK